MPPLRERADDIPLLVEYSIDRYAKKAGKKFRAISKKTLELFEGYDWSGNIRELQNVIERAVVLCDGDTFSIDETWLKRTSRRPQSPEVPLIASVVAHEKELIEAALAKSNGRVRTRRVRPPSWEFRARRLNQNSAASGSTSIASERPDPS
jgi:formate hydrogenlyase transcriptional activator